MSTSSSLKLNLLLIIAAFVLVVAFYEWRMSALKKQLKKLQFNIESLQQTVDNQAKKSTPSTGGSYYPPAAESPKPPAPAPTQNTLAKAPAPKSSTTIQDIFEVPRNAADPDASINKIKASYEELLVTYLFLKKCDKTSASDYQLINSAMQKDLATVNAPSRLKYDILTAAKGSYDELYAKSDCQKPTVETSFQRYTAYIRKLSEKK